MRLDAPFAGLLVCLVGMAIARDGSAAARSRTTLVDGWSSYLTYGTTPERADYVVRSAGADGALESTPLWGLTTNFNSDIILVDGTFVQYPEGAQQ